LDLIAGTVSNRESYYEKKMGHFLGDRVRMVNEGGGGRCTTSKKKLRDPRRKRKNTGKPLPRKGNLKIPPGPENSLPRTLITDARTIKSALRKTKGGS